MHTRNSPLFFTLFFSFLFSGLLLIIHPTWLSDSRVDLTEIKKAKEKEKKPLS